MGKKFNVSVFFYDSKYFKTIHKNGQRQNIIEKLSCCDVVYKINCDASYVGQTKRRLQTKVYKHKVDINKKSGSVIFLHRLQDNHEFD